MKILPPKGPARTRQLALVGALLLGAIYAVSKFIGGGPATAPVPASNPLTRSTTAVPPKAIPQAVKLGKLEPVPEEPATSRNPFRFGTKPPPPAASVPAPKPPVASAPPGPPPPPPVPPIPLKFIGRLVLPDKRVVASLSDGKGTIIQGLEGQIVDGRYRIVKIGEESILIEYVNGTGRQTLPLRGS